MKRIVFLFSFLYLMFTASAQSHLVNNIFYTILSETNKTVQVYWGENRDALYDSNVSSITIPPTVVIDGQSYTVVRIGNYAFYNCRLIKNISIPSTVIYIGMYAFSESGITSIDIPNSVIRIEESAFSGCASLLSILLPNQLDIIKPMVVAWCQNIHAVSIPNSVYKIEGNGLYGSYLNELCIPPSVWKIDSRAISFCSLYNIYLRNSDPYSITIGDEILYDDNISTPTFFVPPGAKVSYQGAPQWSGYSLREEGSNALHFDGIDDYVSLPMEMPLRYRQPSFTIEMWIKPDEIPATGFMALLNDDSWNSDTGGNSVHFQISDSKLSLAVYGLTNHPTSNYTPVANVWQHVAVTYNSTNKRVVFYVNGDPVTTVNVTLPYAKIETSCLGSWLGTQRFFKGAMDEVRIWQSERTEQEIKDNMFVAYESIPDVTFLRYCYNFNQGFAGDAQNILFTGNTSQIYLTDYGKTHCDGILKNFTLYGPSSPIEQKYKSNFVKGVDFPFLYLSSKTETIDAANNSSSTIKVGSNVKCHIQSDQNWLTANLDSLAGNGQFILTATANPANDTRVATVTVSATGVLDKTITVTQSAYVNTGIESPSKETLTFLPNPASDGFTINVGMQKSMISIYESNGSLVLSKQIEGKSYINIASLPSGVYMVKANGRMGKLIKK